MWMKRGEKRGGSRGENKACDSHASSKRSDSATGGPLTLTGDNMWSILICVFNFAVK